jgi:CRP-like cAMP-binding protein
VPDPTLRRMAAVTEEVRFKKNQVIVAEGTDPATLYIVKEGSVSLTFNPDGDSPQTAELKSGAALNGQAVALSHPHRVAAKAMALNTRLLAIPAEEIRKMIAESPDLRGRFVHED